MARGSSTKEPLRGFLSRGWKIGVAKTVVLPNGVFASVDFFRVFVSHSLPHPLQFLPSS